MTSLTTYFMLKTDLTLELTVRNLRLMICPEAKFNCPMTFKTKRKIHKLLLDYMNLVPA